VDETRIDWGEATVDDGQLTAPLTGKADKEWAERVTRVLERLHATGSGWGEIKVTRKKVTVDAVTAGSESDLRHLLESAVLQANADLAPDEPDEDEPEHERSDEDQRMTDAFRAFAPAEKDAGRGDDATGGDDAKGGDDATGGDD
jgi:hypothetical protein